MRCSRTRSGPTTRTMCRHDRPRATNEGTVNQHDAVEVITAKRDGGELSDSQIDWVIANYTSGDVADEHMSSLAMAILLNGMNRRKRSEEHTSELQSLMRISYAVFCLKKPNTTAPIQRHFTQ